MKLQINVPVSGLDLAAPAPGWRRVIPLPKQRAKLHYRGQVRSFDRVWAHAHRDNHSGTTVTQRRSRTLVRDQAQQLNWVFGLSHKRRTTEQV